MEEGGREGEGEGEGKGEEGVTQVAHVAERREAASASDKLIEKTWLVTGGASGLGAGIVRSILTGKGISQGFNDHVIIFARNKDNALAFAESLNQEKREGTKVSVVRCDTSSFKSIQNAVKDLRELGIQQLDVIVHNAGLTGSSNPQDSGMTEDGFVRIFATNVLGTYYLNELLFPLMKKGIIIMVGSNFTNPVTKEKFEHLLKNPVTGFAKVSSQDYATTKWAIGVLVQELSKKYKQENPEVSIYYVHPGFVQSKAYENFSALPRFIMQHIFYPVMGISSEVGAQSVLSPTTNNSPSGSVFFERSKLSESKVASLFSKDSSWLLSVLQSNVPQNTH